MQHLRVLDQQFKIKKEQQDLALEALKRAIKEKPFMRNAEGDMVVFELMHEEELLNVTTLIEALEIRHWHVTTLRSGIIMELYTNDEEKGYWQEEEAFFQVLAPYVEPGYLEVICDEDDAHWRWNFDGQTCKVVYPIISWPDYEDNCREDERCGRK